MALTDIPVVGPLRASVLDDLITELRLTHVHMASDQALATSSTTLVDVTELVAAVAADVTYLIEGALVYTAATTEDIKFAQTFPSGATYDYWSTALSTADVFQSITTLSQTSGTATAYGGGGVGSARTVRFWGRLAMGSTAGNFQVQAAQNTSGASVSTVKAGSYMSLRRVS